MQKKIIALAIAGLASTAAFAQSNVTVYGVVDSYYANVGSAGQNVSAVNSGGLAGSRLGFKGVEDLGGGTKALFTIEHALAVDSDVAYAAAGSSRQAFVGLTGGLGTVILGRLQTMVYNHNAAFNPTFGTATDTLAATARANQAAGSEIAIGTAERLNNAVAYVSPKVGNFTFSGAYTANAAATEGAFQDSTRATELSAMYADGPLAAGYVIRYVNDRGTTGNTSHGIGASYDFGFAKLMAQGATQVNNQDTAALAAADSKYTLTQYGVVAPVGANGAVIASVANNKYADGKTWNAQVVVYKHSLSKRTAVYGGIGSNAAAGGTAASTNSATFAGVTSTAAGDDNRVAAALVGINHSF